MIKQKWCIQIQQCVVVHVSRFTYANLVAQVTESSYQKVIKDIWICVQFDRESNGQGDYQFEKK